jgi:cobalt-zinc-cadmium efflux system membrane fusion protein
MLLRSDIGRSPTCKRLWEQQSIPEEGNVNRRISSRLRKALAVALMMSLWSCSGATTTSEDHPETETAKAKEEHADEHVELSPEALKAAQIETVEATEKETVSLITVTGTVEANQQKMQQATPLVSGRVESVSVVLGDRVKQGDVLAVISSPDVAEMHGKLHEAETRLNLAEQSLLRVQSAENRVGVLQAKARLDEADANLRRTRRLIELGAAAGKDLTSAETAQTTAKAEFDFQSNVSLNREVQEARAEVETTRVEVSHLRNSLGALGAPFSETAAERANHDTSLVTLKAPIGGTVTERFVNAGAGIEAGKPLFTIADISTLWVIANVPEGQISQLSVGTPAEVRSPELGNNNINGRVAYIDPVLNEGTRTGRVRVEISNPREKLKVGMFVAVNFSAPANSARAANTKSIVIPDEAIQRMADRTIVFVPVDKAGAFEARDVELGELTNGFHPVLSGLQSGERVVTKGSFTLKTQLMKGELGEHGH